MLDEFLEILLIDPDEPLLLKRGIISL